MKPASAIFPIRHALIALTLIIALQPTATISARTIPQQSAAEHPLAASDYQNSSAAAAAGCQWGYYPIKAAKLQPEVMLYSDPDNTPLTNLSLGNVFKGKTAHLANSGATDFNGDNKADVFRTVLRNDGFLQWQYSSGGTGAWQDLAYATSDLPVSQMQFGNFDGDLKTDVFASLYDNGLSAYQWQYSSAGIASFANLGTSATYPNRLALGDFNGDGVTDVFTAKSNAATYDWSYSPGGTGAAVGLAHAATDPALLRFGDFNGDGKTDVFAATQASNGSTQWLYSNGGVNSYSNLASTNIPYSELKFGDFNGDGKTDVLVAQPQSDGSLQVVYWPAGLAPAVVLGSIPAPAPALRVGDFNGDGISDLLALRCGMNGPLAFSARQTLAASGYADYNHDLSGDVNGDGQPDLILASTCQSSSGICISHHLQVGIELGTSAHTFTLVAPHQLGSASLNFQYDKVVSGDFNGDQKTDLAVIDRGVSDLTIYVALSNGNGTFTFEPAQTFAGDWSASNVIVGDFNGDSKADLAFGTVCHFSDGSCSNGDTNSIYVAASIGGGSFAMGTRQDLGPAGGWEDYIALAGDFNHDGKTDLVFNSTCQKNNFNDSTCTAGDANLVYTALSNGLGVFTLSAQQVYAPAGWGDYSYFSDQVGDVNGDGRPDLVWYSAYQAAGPTHNDLVVVGFAKPDGSFQLGSVQNLGSSLAGSLSLADLNRDGRADLVWNNPPLGNTDVDTYVAAISAGNGAFTSLRQGSVFTGGGFFQLPLDDDFKKVPSGLILFSTRQDSISSALFVINGYLKLTTLNFKSVAAADGWVLESGENTSVGGSLDSSATSMLLGDNPARKQYRDVLSFATSGLPDNALISKATLSVMRQGIIGPGNPVKILQGFMADIKTGFFGTAPLQKTDFQAASTTSVGPYLPAAIAGWYNIDLTAAGASINKRTTNGGVTQVRLRFKLDDNNNAIANDLVLYSGNAPLASQPQLSIQYFLP